MAKVKLARNRADKSAYIMPVTDSVPAVRNQDIVAHLPRYTIGLTIGPTFLSASLYLFCVRWHREVLSTTRQLFGSRLYATTFILSDFACLCFIGVGGSLAAIYSDQPIGADLMVVGLAIQIGVTLVFGVSLRYLVRYVRWKDVVRKD